MTAGTRPRDGRASGIIMWYGADKANLNKDDKEHHASAESCMEPQKVVLAYHDAFSKETDPQLLNLDALPQNMRDAGLLLLSVYGLEIIGY